MPSPYPSNIVGEPLEPFVYNEINHRQSWQYSGYDQNRSEDQIQYLNNKNGWVKLASSVEIGIENKDTKASEEKLGRGRLKDLGLDYDQFKGTELAKKFILFNTVSEIGNPNNRSGVSGNSNLWNNNSSYGLGGSNFGLQPTPGIQSVNVQCLNRGSIRKASITLKAYNKFQFEIIELLYLRIGYHVLLEWGNDRYYNPVSKKYEGIGTTITEDKWFTNKEYDQLGMIELVNDYRQDYSGNYDGFFGRVVNFNWRFEPDGSYSIELDLITVGDVIESLMVSLPSKIQDVIQLKKDATDNERTSLEEEVEYLIDDWLYNKKHVLASGSIENSNYFSFNNDELYTEEDINSDEVVKIMRTRDSLNNYVKFGEFLSQLSGLTIPLQKGDSQKEESLVILNTNPDQYISYHLNQSPLNPKVCIFKFEITDPSLKGIYSPSYFKRLDDYIIRQDDMVAGRLMNLYLNFDFVKKCLKQNIDINGNLSLFKFLQNICNGLNTALGGVNKLEPIIKNDKIITIIDQNPIPGVIEHLDDKFKKDIVPLEIFGYNVKSKQSTFVTNIDFQTSITPDLASMVSIGATAGGSTTKGIDATFFSKWNAGLQDRFNRSIEYPEQNTELEISERERKEIYEKAGENWDSRPTWKKTKRWLSKMSNYLAYPFTIAHSIATNIDVNKEEAGEVKQINNDPEVSLGKYTRVQYQYAKFQAYLNKKRRELDDLRDKEIREKNYYQYLMNAFGGKNAIILPGGKSIQPVRAKDSRYLKFDDKFISKARQSYKTYLEKITDDAYKKVEKEAETIKDVYSSNQIGFVPIKLGITLQGIAGIKIYNKLSINQEFLPNNYPESVHFIITGVNHSIQDNNWVTTLETLSIPKTKKEDIKLVAPIYENEPRNYDVEGVLPPEERGPIVGEGRLLQFIENRDYIKTGKVVNIGDMIGYRRVLQDFHPDVRENFRQFFEELNENYKDYKIIVNSTGRSIAKSQELKKKNSKNALPGYSLHNYNAGIDFNLVDPNGNIYLKSDNKKEWINSGVPDIAAKYNIIWGGNFNNYNDNVHFAYDIEATGVTMETVYQRFLLSSDFVRTGDITKVDVFKVSLKPNI